MTHSRTKWLLGLMSLLMLLTLSACGDKLDTKIYIGDEMQTNKFEKAVDHLYTNHDRTQLASKVSTSDIETATTLYNNLTQNQKNELKQDKVDIDAAQSTLIIRSELSKLLTKTKGLVPENYDPTSLVNRYQQLKKVKPTLAAKVADRVTSVQRQVKTIKLLRGLYVDNWKTVRTDLTDAQLKAATNAFDDVEEDAFQRHYQRYLDKAEDALTSQGFDTPLIQDNTSDDTTSDSQDTTADTTQSQGDTQVQTTPDNTQSQTQPTYSNNTQTQNQYQNQTQNNQATTQTPAAGNNSSANQYSGQSDQTQQSNTEQTDQSQTTTGQNDQSTTNQTPATDGAAQ
ncbi:hypothetical protein [Lacticaseibacillus saniviri]|nr:hypothetical protein [Lacticaseibacillus saniviri]